MRSVLVVLLSCVVASVVQAAPQWNVLRADERALQLEIVIDGESIQIDESGELSLRIPGFHSGGEPGLPELPAAIRWIALPPRGDVRLIIESARYEAISTGRIRPVPIPRLQRGQDFETPRLFETREASEDYDRSGTTQADALRLGDERWQARQRVVPLRVAPILYDPLSSSISILREARVRIEFEGGQSLGSEPGRPSAQFSGILNPRQAARWRGLPQPLQEQAERMRLRAPVEQAGKRVDGVQPFAANALESDEIRLRVNNSGLWQLRLSDLIADAGIDFPTDLPRSHLRLYEKRPSDPSEGHYPVPNSVDIPFHLLGDPDPAQPVVAGDILIFYGHAPRDLTPRVVDGQNWPLPMEERPDNYNSGTVYFLAFVDPGAGAWKRIAVSSLAPSAGAPQPYFQVVDHFEEDDGYQDNPADDLQPRYHWDDEQITVLDARTRLRTPRPGTSMNVRFALTRTPRLNEPRIVGVSLRQLDGGGALAVNLPLADIDVDPPIYNRLFAHDYDVPVDSFLPGFLDLHLERTDFPNALLRTYLGWIELSYEALYVTGDNGFLFDTGVIGSDADVEVDGYTSRDLLLFETTDPDAPVFMALAPENVVSTGGSEFKLSLHVPQQIGEKRSFAAQTLARIPRLRSGNYDVDKVPDLYAATGPAQVLAIAPEEFAAELQPWLQWRRDNDDNGWTFAYVDVQQIYDEFSGGMKDPGAIKEFIESYYLMHDLRAVLLTGDGNENARELGPVPVRDIIPPSVHSGGFDITELLASDKWYVIFDHVDDGYDLLANYPNQLNKGPDLLIGRLPANSANQLTMLVDKIIAYETPGPDDSWRARALFASDDSYSSGFLGSGDGRCYSYTSIEDTFGESQQRAADAVDAALDGAIDGVYWNLGEIADNIRVPDPGSGIGCFDMDATRLNANSALAPVFYDMLSQGWLWVSYQGHANWNVLAHEQLLVSTFLPARVNNTNKPFIFYGMGCHVSDFLRKREGTINRTVAEEFLMLPGRGAVATYGSSGYEFLTPNANFMEVLTGQMFSVGRGSSTILDADEFDSPWILAEVTAAAEAEVIAVHPGSTYRQMMSQYNLLGDPLLRVDAVPPRFDISDGSGVVDPDSDLIVAGSERAVSLTIDYVDETALGALRVVDVASDANLTDGLDAGEILRDHSAAVVADTPADPRVRQLTLDLPIVAQDYRVVVEAHDGAYADRRPTLKSYHVPMPLAVFLDGDEVQEGSTLVDVGASGQLRLEFTTPIELNAGEILVEMLGATLAGPSLNSADGRSWIYTANAAGTESEQQLDLTLAGVKTTLDFAPAGVGGALGITRHLPYPNPTNGPVSFVCEATGAVSEVQLLVYDLSGRPVFEQRQPVGDQAQFSFEWDGRDLEGDSLANGVYLYRLQVRGIAGTARSEMGRLVFMR